MSWYYNLIIGLGGMIIGMLTFADEIANKIPLLKFLKSLIIKIPFFLLATFGIIWATIQKDNDNENLARLEKDEHGKEIKKIDSTFRAEKRISDSIHEKRLNEILDSSYAKSIKSSNEALAKYNLIFIDSLHKVASTINTKSLSPQLSLLQAGQGIMPIRLNIKEGRTYLEIKFISSNATSYNIKVTGYVFKESNNIFLLDHQLLILGDKFIVPNINTTIQMDLSPTTANENILYIILIGQFSKDVEGKEILPYREAFVFNMKTNSTSGFQGVNYDGIIQYLKSNKIE